MSPQDPEAINILEKAYFESDYNIEEMLRVLFNSDFFKSNACRYKKIKSPVELVAGILRMTEEFDVPRIELSERNSQITLMGQQLFNPPSVEGWHQGLEWIETGSLTERVSFVSEQLGDTSKPGIHKIVNNILGDSKNRITSESCVDRCLDELGALEVSQSIREALLEFVDETGLSKINLSTDRQLAEEKLSSILSVVGSTPEFQRS